LTVVIVDRPFPVLPLTRWQPFPTYPGASRAKPGILVGRRT
jgi:hypothetical protein